jgi:hypothetical protein
MYSYLIIHIYDFIGVDLLADGDKAPSVLNGGLDNFFILLGLGINVYICISIYLYIYIYMYIYVVV